MTRHPVICCVRWHKQLHLKSSVSFFLLVLLLFFLVFPRPWLVWSWLWRSNIGLSHPGHLSETMGQVSILPSLHTIVLVLSNTDGRNKARKAVTESSQKPYKKYIAKFLKLNAKCFQWKGQDQNWQPSEWLSSKLSTAEDVNVVLGNWWNRKI